MSDKKDILRMLIAFIMIFVLLALQLIFFVDKVVFNAETYKPYYQKEDYFNHMSAEVDSKLEIIARYNNIPVEVLENPIDTAFLKNYAAHCTQNFIAYLRGNKSEYKPVFDQSALTRSVETYVQKHLGEAGLAYDSNTAAQVKSIVDASVDAVNGTVMILNPDLLTEFGVADIIRKAFSFLGTLEIMLIEGFAVLAGLLLLLNMKHLMRTLWWMGSALAISSLVLLVVGVFLIVINLPGRLGAADTYIRWMAETGISSLLRTFCLWQVVCIFLAGLIMLFYAFYRRLRVKYTRAKRKKKKREESHDFGDHIPLENDRETVLTFEEIQEKIGKTDIVFEAKHETPKSPMEPVYSKINIRQRKGFTIPELEKIIAKNKEKDIVFVAEDYTIRFAKNTLYVPEGLAFVSFDLKVITEPKNDSMASSHGVSLTSRIKIIGADKLPGQGVIKMRVKK